MNIAVLGGTGVVSSAVEAQLADYLQAGGDVIRLAGPDRFGTSVAVSQGYDPFVRTVFIATGMDFPDALGAAPPSAVHDGPLLLVKKDSIPPVVAFELARLKPTYIVVLGGTGVVSTSVESLLHSYVQGSLFRRAGNNRYETAVSVSQFGFGPTGTAFVATGLNFPDALAGGSAGGAFLGPLLLVPGTSVPSGVEDEMVRLNPSRVFVLGGTAVVSDSVITEIENLFP